MKLKCTKNVIDDVRAYLIKRFGEVQPEWELDLALLYDNIELYKECTKNIKNYGIYDERTGRKNPLLSTVKDLQATITKQIQHFGLSPYASCKINTLQDTDDSDLLKHIMGADDEDE